eukprot:jgi/Mesen1/1452/ME000132S00394
MSITEEMNEKRERIVKASRDVTIHSKKVIFQIHRIGAGNREAALQQASKDLAAVRGSHLARIARELQGGDYWKFRRAYSPGMQEYVEAAALLEYSQEGALLSYEKLNDSFCGVLDGGGAPFVAPLSDYILGVSSSDPLCSRFLGFRALPPGAELGRDFAKKLEVMQQSLVKIESASYTVHVRGSEYPHEMLAHHFEHNGGGGGGGGGHGPGREEPPSDYGSAEP